jgi:hypothetical protein
MFVDKKKSMMTVILYDNKIKFVIDENFERQQDFWSKKCAKKINLQKLR